MDEYVEAMLQLCILGLEFWLLLMTVPRVVEAFLR